MDQIKSSSTSKTKIAISTVSSLLLLGGIIAGAVVLRNRSQASSTTVTAPSQVSSTPSTTQAAVTATATTPVVYAERTAVVPPWVQAEISALQKSVTSLQAMQGTTNYLCPLNATSSSGQCLQIGANGQMQYPLVPYAKMVGGGTGAIGYNSGMTLMLPKAYLEGGMTYLPTTGQVTVPWVGRYEVACMITIDINKMGYVSIARNGVLNEMYGRLYQNNATDSSNGYIGSNTFALPANEKISLVLTKGGTNNGSIQANPQDTWWTIRYIGPINPGTSV